MPVGGDYLLCLLILELWRCREIQLRSFRASCRVPMVPTTVRQERVRLFTCPEERPVHFLKCQPSRLPVTAPKRCCQSRRVTSRAVVSLRMGPRWLWWLEALRILMCGYQMSLVEP